MSLESLRVLVPEPLGEGVQASLAVSAAGPFDVVVLPVDAPFDAGDFDAVLLPQRTGLAELPAHAAATALVVVAEGEDAAPLVDWLRQGAADVVAAQELRSPGFGARLRVAVERRRIEREARQAYATDLATGLPHRQQLVEHMSHLIALRERQPAPMAVLVLRVEGLETITARFGHEAANVLRRKLAVRLRAGVRASDVVASLGDDSYAVLLAALLAPGDAAHVGAKLLTVLRAPFQVAGQEALVAAALGIALHLRDGAQPEALLARACALAAATPAEGRLSGAAANDG
ncbi:MAG: GGDEF domain-containing protein [Piscinibacter sp.]|uniref:GGDEF domain-containing protein n=1 Tax=Piscinibacter sp. TaxID=1903157 RepID=UPI001B48DAA8|nr:GGDEF domain-containing protein [Piscinibacter sp.]MBP5988864.1 GGDEF domain-containing protein [Piscinibacter sp.]MBP6026416.1 GGDEF domain-containing protein [Piscinibacter sp.]